VLRTWAYPTLVTPLFNRLAPLPQGPLRARLAALAARSGYALENVAVMDGSRRSGHANAHVTGCGRAKRVVLLDTLVEALEPAEIEAVTAHEIGHLAHRHMEKYQAAQALVALLWILGFGQMAGQEAFFAGLGLGAASPHLALAVLLAISPVLGLLARPAACLLLRRFEVEADAYAARHSDPAALCRALLRLSRRNVSPLSASPAYAAFHHSHPALPVRVEKLTALAEAPDLSPLLQPSAAFLACRAARASALAAWAASRSVWAALPAAPVVFSAMRARLPVSPRR
jgi:STE24 endopeptidase